MGLLHGIYLKACGPVRMIDTQIRTDLPSNEIALITVYSKLKNISGRPVKGKLNLNIEGSAVSADVELQPGQEKELVLSPESSSLL
jgi:hypothetical protein